MRSTRRVVERGIPFIPSPHAGEGRYPLASRPADPGVVVKRTQATWGSIGNGYVPMAGGGRRKLTARGC